jgi:hypothetical protein
MKSRKRGVEQMEHVKKGNENIVGIDEGNRELGDLGSIYIYQNNTKMDLKKCQMRFYEKHRDYVL